MQSTFSTQSLTGGIITGQQRPKSVIKLIKWRQMIESLEKRTWSIATADIKEDNTAQI
ncbi:MAG: hypothetical protein ABI361_05660 [Nitrososphaera sp.]|jgi:hypothetical protein